MRARASWSRSSLSGPSKGRPQPGNPNAPSTTGKKSAYDEPCAAGKPRIITTPAMESGRRSATSQASVQAAECPDLRRSSRFRSRERSQAGRSNRRPAVRKRLRGGWRCPRSSFVANAAVSGTPFARALTPLPTDRGGVAFPTVNPTGLGWVAEGAPIPAVDLNDSAVVAVAKLAGLVTMSNEFADDNELPIGDLLRKAVADSMGPTLDSGLMFGSGPSEPEGVLDSAPEAIGGPDFRADMITAWGKLVDAGADGASIVAFASARVVAWELSWTTTDGVPIHADGAEAMVGPGIRLIAVPSLSAGQTLVADVSGLYLVVRQHLEAKFSEHAGFANDQAVMRVKGRFAVACPNPWQDCQWPLETAH